MKKLAAIVTVAAMAVSLLTGMETEAAAKPALSEKKMNITVGTSKTLKVKKAKKAVKWSLVSGKGKVILKNKKKSSVQIVAKKAGKAKVQAKVGNQKLVCQVTVKEKQKKAPAAAGKPQNTPAVSPPPTSPSAPSGVTTPPVGTESPDEQALRTFIAEQRAKGAIISENIHDTKQYTWDISGTEAKLIGICWADEEYADDMYLQGELSFSSFPNLEMLKIMHNVEVTGVDVSGNAQLKRLHISDTDIHILDVSKNEELEELMCHFNALDSLDVTHNKKLRILNCGSNYIDELDLSQNTELEDLDCYHISIDELDLTNNVKLTYLSCGANNLKTLDVSIFPDLEYLDCVALDELTTLDVSTNHKLKGISCTACSKLSTLILNPEIEELYIESTAITVIDASQCLKTPKVIVGEKQEYTLIPPAASVS